MKSVGSNQIEKVILDTDLAMLYGIKTKALNQAVKRNSDRFPEDFIFQLSDEEKVELVTNCDRFKRLKHSLTTPYAFTEHAWKPWFGDSHPCDKHSKFDRAHASYKKTPARLLENDIRGNVI